MRVIIYGVGAIGGVVAAALARAGHEVIGIARGAQLAVLQSGPLRLRTPDGDVEAQVPCVADPGKIAFRADDLILLTMKTQDCLDALQCLRLAGVRDQPLFCLQNGVSNEPMALRLFANVHGVTVMMPAGFTDPGEVLCYGTPKLGLFDIGRFPSGSDDDDARLAALFDTAQMRGFVHQDVMASKRGKLLVNLGNCLEAAVGRGADRGDFPARARAEAEAVFRAAGLAWDDVGMDDPRRKALMRMGDIPGAARSGGSTTQSLLRGTGRVETDYLNGEIAYLGRLHGVQTPVNAFLTWLGAAMADARVAPGHVDAAGLAALFADWSAGRKVAVSA
jgi:2-dehydropantoate 2-reductase